VELITEGNFIYSVRYISSSRIKEFYGFVETPEESPILPDPITSLQAQIDQLTAMLGDFILTGGI